MPQYAKSIGNFSWSAAAGVRRWHQNLLNGSFQRKPEIRVAGSERPGVERPAGATGSRMFSFQNLLAIFGLDLRFFFSKCSSCVLLM